MGERKFEPVGAIVDGHPKTVSTLTCCECGATETLSIRATRTILPSVVIAKKFQARGWSVGKNEKRDICSACQDKKKDKKMLNGTTEAPRANGTLHLPVKSEIVLPVQPAPVQATGAAKPRAMEKDDSRIIFGKLNEVYLDEKEGYAPGWSDQRTAADLGVPLDWVQQLRSQFFGPLATNAQQRALDTDISKVVSEAKALVKQATIIQGEIKAMMQHVCWDELNKVVERITELETIATELRKG